MAVTMGHPIAAIATGHGRSGIGILRMSGEGCIERAAKVFSRADGKPLERIVICFEEITENDI